MATPLCMYQAVSQVINFCFGYPPLCFVSNKILLKKGYKITSTYLEGQLISGGKMPKA